MPDYTVKAGDCFSSIAKANGFHKYTTLYQHADNALLRQARTNPNMLVAGDVVKVPPKRPKRVLLILNGMQHLVIHRELTDLRVVVSLIDKTAGTAPASASISGGGKSSATPPDANGMLELLDVDPAGSSGRVEIQIAALPAAPLPGPAVVQATPPAHPPLIVPTEFTDAAPPFDTDAVRVRWTLKIGTLEPYDTLRGTLQRFVNLGYEMPLVEAENTRTTLLIRHWQASTGNAAPSGLVADVRAAIDALHDYP